LNAWQTQERLGSPEGELAIAQAVVYLACAPKSNALYKAWGAARSDGEKWGSLEVPVHLRNAPTRLMKELGYGHAYRYAHDEPGAYAVGETYFPPEMGEPVYYQPVDRGLEIRIGEKLARLRELDRKAAKSAQNKRLPQLFVSRFTAKQSWAKPQPTFALVPISHHPHRVSPSPKN
jgi:putative ATPase